MWQADVYCWHSKMMRRANVAWWCIVLSWQMTLANCEPGACGAWCVSLMQIALVVCEDSYCGIVSTIEQIDGWWSRWYLEKYNWSRIHGGNTMGSGLCGVGLLNGSGCKLGTQRWRLRGVEGSTTNGCGGESGCEYGVTPKDKNAKKNVRLVTLIPY